MATAPRLITGDAIRSRLTGTWLNTLTEKVSSFVILLFLSTQLTKISTDAEYEPSRLYLCVPYKEYLPGGVGVARPAGTACESASGVVPSPQSIVTDQSVARQPIVASATGSSW